LILKSCLWLACILTCAVLLASPCLAQAQNHSSGMNQTSSQNRINASIYILNIGKLDEATGAFDIDFYLGLKSDRPFASDGFEFVNGRADSLDLITDAPTEKFYRIQASLYSHMNFEDYPFDKKTLSIDIEDKNDDDDNVVYIYDASHSGIDSDLALNGWQLDGFKGAVFHHYYPVYNQSFSRLEFDIDLRRPGMSSAIKSLLPVLFIIFVIFIASFIKDEMVDTRLTINTSILIAAVLFHVSIDSYLPPIPYMTMADKLMMLTYLFILAILFRDLRILMKLRS
jgi:hypothetical protein